MSMIIYDQGDKVYYPQWQKPSGKQITVQDRYLHVYPNGKHYFRYLFSDLLDVLVQEMHENVENDLDNVLCIWGHEGSGKSHLAYWIAKKYNPNFDIEKSYTLSFEDLLTKIHDYDDADEGAIFWLDEGTNIANNRDFMQKDSRAFITMLEMFRSRKWCLLFCIPDYNRMDIYLREQRVRYALHAEETFWEHAPTRSRGYFQLTRMDNRSSGGYREKINVGYGIYPKIPDEDLQIYNRIKNETQNSKLNELYDNKNKKNRTEKLTLLNKKLILRLYENDQMSYEEISEYTGLSLATIRQYCSDARKERGD